MYYSRKISKGDKCLIAITKNPLTWSKKPLTNLPKYTPFTFLIKSVSQEIRILDAPEKTVSPSK